MTREDIDELNPMQPYSFETDREEDWCKCGLVEGADVADKAMIEKACNWLTLNIGMLLKVLDVEYNTNETDVKDFIKDFKQAMEE